MRRSLFNLFTLLSLLLLLIAVAVWLRSGSWNDAIAIRTAPSYTGSPNLKRIVIRTYDGWVVSFHRKFVPRVDAGPPPWRSDVPLSFKRLQPPTNRNTLPLSDEERRAFEAAAAEAYASEPLFRWTSDPSRPQGPGRMLVMSTWWTQLGFGQYAPAYLIDDADYPGAYRDERTNIPHGVVVAVASVLPAAWLGRWARGRVREHLARRRKGLCPGCGYDLRASPQRCPECGSAVEAPVPLPEMPHGWRPLLRRRWEVVAFAAVVVFLILAAVRGWEGAAAAPVANRQASPWAPQAASVADMGFDRERAAEEFGSVRFEAVWHSPRTVAPPTRALAHFGVAGPLADTVRKLPWDVMQVAVDRAGSTVYGTSGGGELLSIADKWGTTPLGRNTSPRGFGRCTGVAFDTRRRRLVVASSHGFGTTIYTYAVDSDQWSAGVEVGRGSEVLALAYSAEHDCVYGVTAPSRVDPPAVVRMTPQGDPEWRIPLLEPIPLVRPGASRRSFQLVASGPLLALITADDAYGRAMSDPSRLTLIDPTASRVVYRGELRPHVVAEPPSTAPARAE